MYKEIVGNLITLAKQGEFDVIAHGCNCFCTMGAGIAPQMAMAFYCDEFPLEGDEWSGDINKLGQIDWEEFLIDEDKELIVVNAYTQYGFGRNHKNGTIAPVDYEAITLCMRKMNHVFQGKHIGLPQIGAGLAGGDWERIKNIIQTELYNCDVTVVIFDQNIKK